VASSAEPALVDERRRMTAPVSSTPGSRGPDPEVGEGSAGAPRAAGAPIVLAQVQLGLIEAMTLTGGMSLA
jgi:hypothetical protein